ncbi:hypothetical protein ACKWTF_013043 [Chironomus riparius]
MKIFAKNLIFLMIFQTSLNVNAQKTCLQYVNNTEFILNCCKIPDITDKAILNATKIEHRDIFSGPQDLAKCLLIKHYFEKLHLWNFDINEVKQYYLSRTYSMDWKESENRNLDYCFKYLPNYTSYLQKYHNITEEQCDMKYEAFLDCTAVNGFKNCPQNSIINGEKCKMLKYYVDNFLDDPECLKAYIQVHGI